jgi:hypothetical protein
MVGPKARETPLASPLNSVPSYMSRPNFGNQEYVFAPTRDDATNQLFRVAISVNLRCINQRHAQRNTFAQRFFLNSFRMSFLAQARRTLTECLNNGSVVEFHGSLVWTRATGRSLCRCSRGGHCCDARHSQAEGQEASCQFTPIQSPTIIDLHFAISLVALSRAYSISAFPFDGLTPPIPPGVPSLPSDHASRTPP